MSPAPGARIALPDALAHHALRVLRLRAGEAIVLFDGKGGEYPAVLETEGKTDTPNWGRSTPGKRSRPAHHPGQGLPSGDKMDWVIEKPWSWARSASSRWRPSAACCN